MPEPVRAGAARGGGRQRIAVVGRGGAGKSTLSRQLGTALALPVVDLDQLFWRADSDLTPAARCELVAALVATPRWICDGDHLPTQPLRFAAADTVLFLDLPRLWCLLRVLERAVRNRGARRQPARRHGVPLSRWRTVAWVWSYPRAAVRQNLTAHGAGADVIVVRHPSAVSELVARLAATAPSCA